jgi:hypothetical protein
MIFANRGKNRRMREDESKRGDDLREAEAKALPAREALSLISTDPLSGYGVEDLAGSDPSGGAASPQEPAGRLPDTDAAASGAGEESVTSDDRTLQSTRVDSASSKT